jgi:hypothetical protein
LGHQGDERPVSKWNRALFLFQEGTPTKTSGQENAMRARNFVGRLVMILVIMVVAMLVFQVAAVRAQSTAPGSAMTPVQTFVVTPEMLAAAAGGLLALIFKYVKGLNTKFAALPAENKQAIMLVMMVVVGAAVYGLGCAGVVSNGLTCDKQGFWQLVWLVGTAVAGNVITFQATPQTQAVKDVKAVAAQKAASGYGSPRQTGQ